MSCTGPTAATTHLLGCRLANRRRPSAAQSQSPLRIDTSKRTENQTAPASNEHIRLDSLAAAEGLPAATSNAVVCHARSWADYMIHDGCVAFPGQSRQSPDFVDRRRGAGLYCRHVAFAYRSRQPRLISYVGRRLHTRTTQA